LLRGAAALAVTLAIGCGPNAGHAPGPQPADPALVETATGALRGLVAPDHRFFGGIPYAAPPVGPLRWQLPEPAPHWRGIRDATDAGARCIQETTYDADFGRPTNEDCLTLNVWTPASSSGQRWPVMVWVHGGGFANGSGDLYEAQRLVTRGNIIVVTVNYRLGALGFLAHPALGANGAVGNYGLADQQAALRWVRDNIADFGGDPGRVTLAGESAGAMSVCDHMVAPGSVGLFRAAIIQSGPCQAQADLAAAERLSDEYAAAAGCAEPASVAQCLRALPADRLLTPPKYVRLGAESLTGPVTGSSLLPADPITGFADGTAAKVPVLIGTNEDEFRLFVALQHLQKGEQYPVERYPKLLADTFGAHADEVGRRYPLAGYDKSVPLAYAAAVTDAVFACPADRMAADLSRSRPVFAYEFADRSAPAPEPMASLPYPVGAAHALEVHYLFGIRGAAELNPAQSRLSDEMIDYWTRFVTAGTPHVDGQPDWPPMERAPGAHMSFRTDGNRLVNDFEQAHQCAFWATAPVLLE
jgi:para-nitrobenzyl esterase